MRPCALRPTLHRSRPAQNRMALVTTGPWSLVKGFEHVSSEVYLQWLEWNQDGPRLLDSVRVEELSSGFWAISEPVVISRRNCSMQLAATHTYSSETARFVLQPAGRGKYSIRKIAKK